jgi:hypothetical protein
MSDLSNVIEVVHDGCVLSLGTEEYHTILGYCKTLNAPRKLTKSKHSLDSVHLNPRILTLPESLGITSDSDVSERDAWARIEFAEGSHVKVLNVLEDDSEPIEEISYVLNLEDAYPSSGGLIAHGKSIVRNAIRMIGLGSQSEYTFEARISKNVSSMNSAEEAVYERLKLGDAEIIMNSLIGSPQHVETLTKNGRVVFLPDFNHLGIFPQYLIHGDYDAVSAAALENSIETTIFKTGESAYALVCAPPTWQSGFVSAVRLSGLSLWPVVSVASSRRLLRCESLHLS